jgi:hypothetical protein
MIDYFVVVIVLDGVKKFLSKYDAADPAASIPIAFQSIESLPSEMEVRIILTGVDKAATAKAFKKSAAFNQNCFEVFVVVTDVVVDII